MSERQLYYGLYKEQASWRLIVGRNHKREEAVRLEQANRAFASEVQETRLQTAMEMIRRLYNVRFQELESREQVGTLCRELLHHNIQSYFQEKVLDMMRTNIKEDVVYHICDAFLIHTVLFTAGGKRFFFGPYVNLLMTERDAAELRKALGLRDLDLTAFLVYRGTFPVLSGSQVRAALNAFTQIVDPEGKEKSLRDIVYTQSEEEATDGGESREHHALLVELRYRAEREFFEAISHGNASAALRCQQKIAQDVIGLNQFGATMESKRIGAAILRTTTRVAAIQAGLPPIIIDRISGDSAQEVRRAKNPDQVLASQDRMIRAFCKAIRDARESRYSALVQMVLYALEHNYAQGISLPRLAEELNVSENHMISVFKKEVGVTPNRYLTTVRMKQAALLLIHGSMTVGSISAAVGIMDSNYFVKLFRNEFGETPTAYRKRHTV